MNKKLTKLLSIFLIAGMIGTTCAFSLTGCSNSDDDDKKTEQEEGSGSGTDDKDKDKDKTPTVTGVTITSGAEITVGGDDLTLTATVAGTNSPAQTVTWSITAGGDKAEIVSGKLKLKAGAAAGDTITVKATSTVDATKSVTKVITVKAAGGGQIDPPVDPPVTEESAYDKLSKAEGNIIKENYATTNTIATFSDWSTAGVYASDDGISVSGGKLVSASGANHTVKIAFGDTSTAATLEWTFKAAIKLSKDDKNYIQLLNDGSNVGLIKVSAGKPLKYTIGGVQDTDIKNNENVVSEQEYEYYFKYETATKKLTFKIDGKTVIDEVVTTIAAINGVSVESSDGGKQTITVDDIAVSKTLMSAEAYKTYALGQLDVEYAKYKTEGDGATHTLNKGAIDSVYTTQKAAIETAGATTEQMAEALAAAKTGFAAVESDEKVAELRAAAITALNEYKGGSSSYDENATQYTAAVNEAKAAINAATTATTITAALDAGKTAIDGIDNDETVVAAFKTEHANDVSAYRTSYEESAALSTDEAAAVKDELDGIVASAATALAGVSSTADGQSVIDSHKAQIKTVVDGAKQTFAQYKASVKTQLEEYVTAKKADFTGEDAAAIETVGTTWSGKIDALTEGAARDEGEGVVDKTDLTAALASAKAAIDDKVAEINLANHLAEKKTELATYVTAQKDDEITHAHAGFKAAIDAAATAAALGEAADYANIAAVDAALASAKEAIDAVVTQWTAAGNKKLAVTYNTMGGNTLTAGTTDFGGALVTAGLPTPTKENAMFVKWWANEACTEEIDTTALRYADVTLYAEWKEADVTITLKVDGQADVVIKRTASATLR